MKGQDNKNCMWECKVGYYETSYDCWPCARRECAAGQVFTPCSKYEDGHCRVACVNATKPDDHAAWADGCSWECTPGYVMREKVYAGWVEYACELELLQPWSGWW